MGVLTVLGAMFIPFLMVGGALSILGTIFFLIGANDHASGYMKGGLLAASIGLFMFFLGFAVWPDTDQTKFDLAKERYDTCMRGITETPIHRDECLQSVRKQLDLFGINDNTYDQPIKPDDSVDMNVDAPADAPANVEVKVSASQ
jgi:hypothetical protein